MDSDQRSDTHSSGAVRTVTVTAIGAAAGQPDVMTLSLGITAMAPSATDALAILRTKTLAVLAVCDDTGIDRADVQTAGLVVNPTYEHRPEHVPHTTGYVAGHHVSIVVRDLDRVGAVIDAAAEAVGDGFQMHDSGFSHHDATDHYRLARADALSQARHHAEELAAGIGARVGPVVSISDGTMPAAMGMYPTARPLASIPIAPGTHTITAIVTVTFELL